MNKFLKFAGVTVLVVHGLIHLLGVIAYLQLGEIQELPYKTTLLKGSWQIGAVGMEIFGFLWTVPLFGFLASAFLLLSGSSWGTSFLASSALISLVLTGLDWDVAFMGAAVNVFILVGAAIAGRINSGRGLSQANQPLSEAAGGF